MELRTENAGPGGRPALLASLLLQQLTPILFPQELSGRKASGAGAAESAKAEEKS